MEQKYLPYTLIRNFDRIRYTLNKNILQYTVYFK